ncbi:hypothetical protein QQF64_011959 [Cirrhinus molitorella]|uniref:Uncharacterized protein n=1 Tax=Cirrhinus molitorella TaxID=172907 RepID=A0ABR3LU65_9TELE
MKGSLQRTVRIQKGKERKGKERKGKERKGKERIKNKMGTIDFYSLMLTDPWPSQILIKIRQQGTGENEKKKYRRGGVENYRGRGKWHCRFLSKPSDADERARRRTESGSESDKQKGEGR